MPPPKKSKQKIKQDKQKDPVEEAFYAEVVFGTESYEPALEIKENLSRGVKSNKQHF